VTEDLVLSALNPAETQPSARAFLLLKAIFEQNVEHRTHQLSKLVDE